jgi:hypothetical protein
MTCVNLSPYLIDFDIDGQPAGEDFLMQVEEMFDSIEESKKNKIQQKVFQTLDSQDDDFTGIVDGFSLFDSDFKLERPPNLNFTL